MKKRGRSRVLKADVAALLQHANVGSLQALLALLDFEFDLLVFDQGLEAAAGDVTEVGEEVSTTRVLSDEAVALADVEPLDGADALRRVAKAREGRGRACERRRRCASRARARLKRTRSRTPTWAARGRVRVTDIAARSMVGEA